MITAYADSSALVKLAVDEAESDAIRRFLGQFDEVATSRVGLVETRRAISRAGGDVAAAVEILRVVHPIELDVSLAESAAAIRPTRLRTLDAIHLASALRLYAVDVFVTYDERLASAAREAGMTVASPA